MYIRKTTSQYKGKVYTNYLLVKSVLTPKGPRQKTICSLGSLKPRSAEEWKDLANKLRDALVGQESLIESHDQDVDSIIAKVTTGKSEPGPESDNTPRRRGRPKREPHDSDVVPVQVNKVTTENIRFAGPVHAGVQFWRKLDLDTILTCQGFNQKERALTLAMVMNRLIHPLSEHAMPDWIRQTALSDISGYDFTDVHDENLYRHLDRLYPCRHTIESRLFQHEQELFNLDSTVYLYDLTSTYFEYCEGQAALNEKAMRGYSRDKRPDCPQVVMGLVINPDGFPTAHEIFNGNTRDNDTITHILDALSSRVGLSPEATVVVDRGMAFDKNLAEIRAHSLHYLVATRQSERDHFLDDLENMDDFVEVIREPSPTNPCQDKSWVRVKKCERNGETFVLCLSEGRAEKDRAIRLTQEKRFLVDSEKLQRRIAAGRLIQTIKIGEAMGRIKERYPRVSRYYHLTFDEDSRTLTQVRDEARYAKASQLDGSYILRSDRGDWTAEEAWRVYSLLTRVEESFRDMKSPLQERPIFHQLTRRVETHIFLCVLAYHLLISIEHTLRRNNDHRSWATIREQLGTHVVQTIVLPSKDGAVLRIRRGSDPEPIHRDIYSLLEISDQLMRPIRTWSSSESPGISDEKNREPA